MVIGTLEVDLYLEDSQSLKSRRRVIKGLIARLRQKFNVAVTEIGDKNLWQRTTLAMVSLSDDSKYLDGLLSTVLNYLEREKSVQVLDHRVRVF